MSGAETAVRDFHPEIAKKLEELPRVSKASQSEARWDWEFGDGSSVTITSRNGEQPILLVNGPQPIVDIHADIQDLGIETPVSVSEEPSQAPAAADIGKLWPR